MPRSGSSSQPGGMVGLSGCENECVDGGRLVESFELEEELGDDDEGGDESPSCVFWAVAWEAYERKGCGW